MPERQCKGCTHQKEWGCEAKQFRKPDEFELDVRDSWVNPALMPVDIDGEPSYACPRQPLKEHPRLWNYILQYYRLYKKGFLPQMGAVMDQSNKAMQVFSILDAANSECDKEEAEKFRRKQAQKHPKGPKRR